MFPVRYKLGFYISKDGILHSQTVGVSEMLVSVYETTWCHTQDHNRNAHLCENPRQHEYSVLIVTTNVTVLYKTNLK
jgi:hypothetical protein